MRTIVKRLPHSIAIVTMLVSLCGWQRVNAYDRDTHQAITDAAVLASYLGDPEQRARLGFRRSVVESKYAEQVFPSSKSTRHSVLTLIKNGADWEDDVPPGPTTHFFDPRNGRGLELDPVQYVGLNGTEPLGTSTLIAISTINSLSVPSPRWVITGVGASNPPPLWPGSNDYSIPNAREQLYRGLTDPNPRNRNSSMGRMFESLGRTMHHLQDMAQPQHVRNDGHLSERKVDGACNDAVVTSLDFVAACKAYKQLRRESIYETWTNREDVRNVLPFQGYAPVFPGSPTASGTRDGVSVFTTPLRFWQHQGKGIAEYTSRNFLTQGTLEVAPPQTDAPFDVPLATLCGTAVPPCGLVGPALADASVKFFPSVVDDQFRPGSAVHPYAKTHSIFNQDLTGYAGRPMYAVNRFTFAVDHQYLIPRAVAYSAGLINYFFRGDMEVTPPEEGIYAVVDTSTSGCGTPCGFRWIRLKIRNTTPGGEPMGKGNLIAVARFHKNKCFRPDLSGNYDVPPFERSCRNPAEEIVVSLPRPVVAGEIGTVSANAFAFDFSANPIPIDASDLDLQVIFRGALGEESDAIALHTVDIAEPNFLGMLNVTDYVYDVASKKYLPIKDITTTKKVTALGVQFKAATPPIGTLPQLDGGQFTRLAVLANKGAIEGTVLGSRGDIPFRFDVNEFGFDANDNYVRTCPVNRARALYWEFLFIYPQVRDEGGTIKREGEAAPEGEQSLAVTRKQSPEAKAVCGWSTEGIYDMSTMSALDVAQAVPFPLAAIWKVPPAN